jgi:hypothetical protein
MRSHAASVAQVQVRRESGDWQAATDVSGLLVILPRTHVGEHILLLVWEGDGRSAHRDSARLRVRAATRVELCLPTTGWGAYPSYCAPENAPQGD